MIPSTAFVNPSWIVRTLSSLCINHTAILIESIATCFSFFIFFFPPTYFFFFFFVNTFSFSFGFNFYFAFCFFNSWRCKRRIKDFWIKNRLICDEISTLSLLWVLAHYLFFCFSRRFSHNILLLTFFFFSHVLELSSRTHSSFFHLSLALFIFTFHLLASYLF